jgi:hypothetical protein
MWGCGPDVTMSGIGSGGGVMWTCHWTFGFHKTSGFLNNQVLSLSSAWCEYLFCFWTINAASSMIPGDLYCTLKVVISEGTIWSSSYGMLEIEIVIWSPSWWFSEHKNNIFLVLRPGILCIFTGLPSYNSFAEIRIKRFLNFIWHGSLELPFMKYN